MAIIERDGCKYADDETLRELLEYWDDDDVVCDGFPLQAFVCSIGDGFVAVMYDGRLLSEDDVYAMANAKLREDYPAPVEIAWLERDVVEAAGSCGCQRRRVEVATVAARELLRGGRA